MPLEQVLYDSGSRMTHAYFPTNSIVSMLYLTESGASTELAMMGRESMVGISLIMGGAVTSGRAVVQSAGRGYRIQANLLIQEYNRAGPVLHLMLRYTQALMTQMSQTAVCIRHHTLHQQLCRRLLLMLDRLDGNQLVMTQESMSRMLGVRREGVTKAMHEMQTAGLIRYRRGHISVLKREGIEQCACECYAVVKQEYDRLLPSSAAT